MITFLFWNLNGKPLQATLGRLAQRHDVDVVILTECRIPTQQVLEELDGPTGMRFHRSKGVCPKVSVYARLPPRVLQPVEEEARLAIHSLELPGQAPVLLAAVHFPSKLYWSPASQSAECEVLARSLRLAEEAAGHRRTALVGDFNMDPFEEGVVKANGLHAVMTRRLALRESRTVQSREYPFFYNPMWGLFGDAADSPPGTYYYEASEHVAFYWHMYDQVLLRPALLPLFRSQGLQILTTDGTVSFLSARGTPDVNVSSDHLPVLFGLDLGATGVSDDQAYS